MIPVGGILAWISAGVGNGAFVGEPTAPGVEVRVEAAITKYKC